MKVACCHYADADHLVAVGSAVGFEAEDLKACTSPALAVAVAGTAGGYPSGCHTLMAACCACHRGDLQTYYPCPDSCRAAVAAESEDWAAADCSALYCQTCRVPALFQCGLAAAHYQTFLAEGGCRSEGHGR